LNHEAAEVLAAHPSTRTRFARAAQDEVEQVKVN